MKFVLLTALLVILSVSAAAAEETVTPMGNRWYKVEGAVVQIPYTRPNETDGQPRPVEPGELGVTGIIRICLDDVPGGIAAFGHANVKPLAELPKNAIIVRRVAFFPVGSEDVDDAEDGGMMAYASVVIEGPPGSLHRIKVTVRGER